MFETSVVRVREAAAPRRVGLLTASIAFHSCVVVAAVVMTVSSVRLPEKAPNTTELFRPVSLPPPLGNSQQAPARPHAPQPPAPARPAPPTPAVTAPPVVPDTITPAAASTGSEATTAVTATGTGEGSGSPIGVDGGVGTGEPGVGVGPDTILRPGAGVTAPVVLHRVDPVYPTLAVKTRLEGIVIVECIIGKNGVCRDPQILRTPSPVFNQSALDAVQQWRFKPGTYRDEAVDTYFDLTIVFKLN